jgi:hypothetical protein
MDTGNLQVASGMLQAGDSIGTFVNQQRTAGAITAQSDFDTKLAALQANDAIRRGSEGARAAERRASQTVGAARAGLAANGVDLSSGSAERIQAQDAGMGELDAQLIRNNAAREAMGYTTNAALSALGAQQRAQAIKAQSYATLATGAAKTYGIFPKSTVKMPYTGKQSDVSAGDSASWGPPPAGG